MNNNCCSNPFIANCCPNNRCCQSFCNPCCFPVTGPQGPTGSAATVTVGSTITGEPGTPASVTNSGTSSNAILNFVIPRGEQGITATVNVGSTTTLPPGSEATVTNVGTSTDAILNFGIPGSNSTSNLISGSFISRNAQSISSPNIIIGLPITLNTNDITNNNGTLTVTRSGNYLINYGIRATTNGNIVGLYVNGTNLANTNIITNIASRDPSASIILNLNANDTLSLGVLNATTINPLILTADTLNAYVTINSLN